MSLRLLLFIYLFVCLFVCLFVYLFVCLFVCLFMYAATKDDAKFVISFINEKYYLF